MQPARTLLIGSSQVHWIRLQALLCTLRDVQVIREAHRRGEIIRIVTEERPDIVFVGSDLPDLPIVPLVHELREVSPASRVVVVGEPLDGADRTYLVGLGVYGVLLWRDVAEGTLGPIVGAVRHDLLVVSATVSDRSIRLGFQRETWVGNSALAGQDWRRL